MTNRDKLIESVRNINSYIKEMEDKIYLLNKTKLNIDQVLEELPPEEVMNKYFEDKSTALMNKIKKIKKNKTDTEEEKDEYTELFIMEKD